ncbi:MAG: protoporphyrinogen oxidase [Methanoregulaceae archaeon PtaU1.Bin059]|nr:MAG: protoporphyrinogen oxidase [Methanoregulaceae archaeon PtaB.Bin152]OPY37872.1 MAG: protoporphyrinogen oxidase [Methanoregulaceae archaeon PtaU1.Bin059]
MPQRILVAYASKRGSTAEIARAVAGELERQGIGTEVMEMDSVVSLEPYDGLVIGAPVYTGKLFGDVASFVRRHADKIGRIPVAAFLAGIAPVYPKAGDPMQVIGLMTAALQPVTPVAVTMFAGKLDPSGQSFAERSLTKLLKVPVGDFRDWNAIAAWSRQLPDLMQIGGA